MRLHDRQSAGFSLVELLIVISIIGIIAGLIIPGANPSLRDQLQSTAQLIANDIAYARGLAVSNGSSYKLSFDLTNNQYVLRHSGTNSTLNTLPPSPFHLRSDAANQHTIRLADLPRVNQQARLFAVYAQGASPATVSDLEFGPLGETTRTQPTIIWLTVGTGADQRWISVRVNPVTGLTWVENFQATNPALSSGGSGS